MYALLTKDDQSSREHFAFKQRGEKFLEQLPMMRSQWRESLIEDLETLGDRRLLFSAELISAPPGRPWLERFATFLRQYTDSIEAIAYVRSPRSYAVSTFQQQLKGPNYRELKLEFLWPKYRERFSQLDDIVGRSSVTLRHFSPQVLLGGDVVQDFANIIGITLQSYSRHQLNTTLSAESTALLYVQRRLGQGFVGGFDGAFRVNRIFLDYLRPIGNGKLYFDDRAWDDVENFNRPDQAWMEGRLGQDLAEHPPADVISISSEQELFDVAVANQDALYAAVPEEVHCNHHDPLKRITLTLDALQQHCLQSIKQTRQAS